MSSAPGRIDELLGRIVAGELAPDAPEVQAAVREEPGFEERLDEAQQVARALEDAGQFERSVIEEAAALDAAPGESNVLGTVLSETSRATGSESSTTRKVIVGIAAAAVIVISTLVFRDVDRLPDDGGSGLRGGEVLGTHVQLQEPIDEVQSFARFRWSYPLESGGWFRVVVHDPRTGLVIDRSPELAEAHWEPADTSGWPDRIRWEVQPYDGTGAAIGSPASGVASLSRP